jgi:hypothetical protein
MCAQAQQQRCVQCLLVQLQTTLQNKIDARPKDMACIIGPVRAGGTGPAQRERIHQVRCNDDATYWTTHALPRDVAGCLERMHGATYV